MPLPNTLNEPITDAISIVIGFGIGHTSRNAKRWASATCSKITTSHVGQQTLE